jgi:hypothetical protein
VILRKRSADDVLDKFLIACSARRKCCVAAGARDPGRLWVKSVETRESAAEESGLKAGPLSLCPQSWLMLYCTSMDKNTNDILEAVNFIKEKVEQLPTKDEVRAIVEEVVDEKLTPIHATLADINRRLDALEEHYANLKGVTKEIDEIRAEVRGIQKHLGIDRKIAA